MEAVDSTGAPIGHAAARAFAWRDALGAVHLDDEAGARAALAVELAPGDDELVGKEVAL